MIKLLTHTDLDGIGCYIVADLLIKDNIDVEYCNYSDINKIALNTLDNHDKYSHIYITDISVNESVANELNRIKHKVTLLDHHKTATWLNKYEWATVTEVLHGDKTSGTSLFYQHLNPNAELLIKYTNNRLAEFVEMVRLYDTWEWYENDDIVPKLLNDLLKIHGKDKFIEDMMSKLNKSDMIINNVDNVILEVNQAQIDRYVLRKNYDLITKEIKGYKVGIVITDRHVSELGNKLCELNPQLDLVAIIQQKAISFRTNKDNVDLSEFAKYFGGGGHPKASGISMSDNKLDLFIDSLFNENL